MSAKLITKSILICSILALSACASYTRIRTSHEQLQQAQAAFASKDYQKSYRLLVPLAKAGNAKAEYALGYQYFHGLGIPQDLIVSKIWMNKAAAQNYQPAINALAEINKIENESMG